MEATLAGALILLRLGWLRRAGALYLVGIWLFTTLVMAYNGGIRSPAQVFYVTLPISAAWLFGYGGAVWAAGMCLVTAGIFSGLEAAGVSMPVRIPASPFGLWALLVQACLIGAVPVAQSLGALRVALNRSKRSEGELSRYRDQLEELVEQRTTELVRARDEAEAANRAKTAFLANMSHELRTPLNTILGFSGLARDRASSAEQVRDLDAITRSGEYLLSLINDLLDMSRIEAGSEVLRIGTVEVGRLVRDVEALMGARAEQKHLALMVEVPAVPIYVQADAGKLRRILINLASNAIRYTDRGSVTLRVNSRNAEEPGQLVLKFEVEDTGIGIAPEDHGRIFDEFIQLDLRRKQRGAGLGLTITRRLVELMGGTIQLESAPSLGSRFGVELTVERASEFEIAERESEYVHVIRLEPGHPEYRVLIVEDEKENWILLERLLQKVGFQVRIAEDGEQGIEEFQAWRPNFIWMDLLMPKLDGLEAARRIRRLPEGAEVKIAAVTAFRSAAKREEALAAGFDDYVGKPYRPEEILDCMARHLSLRYRREDATSLPASDLPQELGVEMAALPAELRSGLREAVVTLDSGRILEAIRKVAERNPTVGGVLEKLAGRYSYTAMLNAIDLAEKGPRIEISSQIRPSVWTQQGSGGG
jgi:signal transduction histidine kinase/CheY-like chemotaxis protein